MRINRLFMLLAVAILTIACGDSGEPDGNNAEIVISTENPMWLNSEQSIYEIHYTIKNRDSATRLKAQSNVEWASIVEIKDDRVTFLALKNDEAGERRGIIYLSYGDTTAEVTLYQQVTIDENFTATTTAGSVFTHCNNASGTHSYCLVLSTVGLKDDGSFYATAPYYVFDLYASEAVSKETEWATIPNGTYRLTADSQPGDRTISCIFSYYTYMGSNEGYYDAEVVIKDGSIVANVALATGENHHIEYSGKLEIPVYNATVIEGLSTLTGDHTFNIDGGVFVGAFVGDLLYNGCNTCQVYMYEYLDYETGEERGDQFQIDLQLASGSRDVEGTYTHGTTAGHFIPGSAEDLGGQYMQQNSWYMTAGYIDFAPLVRGMIKVENEGGGVYLFTIDTVDDRGNAIRGTFRGTGEFIDW